MESGVVAVIVLALLIGGVLALVARQRLAPWSLPSLRALTAPGSPGATGEPEPDRIVPFAPSSAPEPAPSVPAGPRSLPGAIASTHAAESAPRPAELIRLDLPPTLSPVMAARLDRIEQQIEELHRAVERQADDERAELVRIASRLVAQTDAADARREAALDRLRGDLLRDGAGAEAVREARTLARRAEVSGDLYARLARFEAALAAVTNPILLPGEPYAPPAELPAEALNWDNWNDVGERAFALADAFSAQRLYLSVQARADVSEFITALRQLLTRSIYPNLQADLDAAQQAALRSALEEFAASLPAVRAALEREHREG